MNLWFGVHETGWMRQGLGGEHESSVGHVEFEVAFRCMKEMTK